MAEDTPVRPETPRDQKDAEKTGGTSAPDQAGIVKKLKDKLTIPRSATPYFVGALLTAVAMGWYFFLFVPQKLEYFVGQRFRTLAVASGQIKSKAESLAESLNTAPTEDGKAATVTSAMEESTTAKYLRLLIPEIQLVEDGGTPRSTGLQLKATHSDADRKIEKRATVAWGRVASQGAAASAGEFDDLVVADKSGHVVWQREKTTPRLGNLTELLYAEDDKGTLMSPSWAVRTVFPAVDAKKTLPTTATLKPVRVGAISTWMLVQVVHLESTHLADPNQETLYVAGFVSRARLQQQAMRIPLAWLIVVWLPIALLFLVLPFIKLATMNAKERFSVVNLILMAIGTIATAGLAAVIPFGPRSVSDAEDRVLENVATDIDRRLAQETTAVLDLATTLATLGDSAGDSATATKLLPCAVQVRPWTLEQCDLWTPLNYFSTATLVPELDVAIWLDDRGGQFCKWTTKAQLTGRISHRSFEHFQNLTSGSLWYLPSKNNLKFTIEPLRAPTTAEMGVVFAALLTDLVDKPKPSGAATTGANEPRYLALNIRPHAVVDAVLPPGYGFAIVAPDGRVLFHSSDGLSLEENFFEEVSNAQGVRERMQSGRGETWSGDYHGTPHRIHVQPVRELQGCLWKIVTFQDLNPRLASIVDHQSGTFRLFTLNLALLLIVALLAWWYLRSRGRDVRDLLTAPVARDPMRLSGLLVLMVLALVALAATEHARAHQWSNLLYLWFVLLPFMAVGVCLYSRSPGARSDRGDSGLLLLELGLVILLVGAVPAAGFARIVQRALDVQATERWLEAAHRSIVAHAARARARANSPGYGKATRDKLQVLAAFRGGADSDALHFYVSRSPLWRGQGPESDSACQEQPGSGQMLVRNILKWTIFSSDHRGDSKVKACAGTNLLRIKGDGVAFAATASPAVHAEPGDVAWERWILCILILGGAIAAVYWARGRLKTQKALGAATFEQVLTLIGSDGNEGIMLIGPPRTRKDRVVKDAVAALPKFNERPHGPEPIYRIKLLDRTLDAAFLTTTLADVSSRSKEPALLDDKKRLWILVSNLEAQLTKPQDWTAVLELLEKLLERPEGEPARVVVVTTSTDPIAQFHEIFTKEREDIHNDDGGPEVQLSRSSLVLSRFRRCYLPIAASPSDPWWKYDPTTWRSTLCWEAAGYAPLVEVADAIRQTFSSGGVPRKEVSQGELARAFRSQARATYDLLWESCTRCEKIVLVQLAQEGFITTRNCEVVWGLISKGLIVERPRPTIFNNSFRQFLRHIEHDHIVEEWEREDGNGLWVVAGRLIGSSLIAGGLFYLTTQDFSVDSLLPVVSGTGMFGAPAVRALLARVTMRGASAMSG